ncbi:NRDE family protein [Hyalangium rubrum]|uniref:NRDE family protein n=1 Tax=Hyalangium rubrum TaxID=3103134 RepID=A0ABU5GWR3_9BACT|nr:NRDE family protein [Hyalangium sp. s54d21]MDY7224982.1 NRDE family protein [Hyalangium sp. s54d21]
MCTLLILRHVHPEWPLILASNRDELYARPTTGPQVLAGSPRILVPGLDGVRGGSWMGVTEGGLFVGLTNQRGSQAQGLAPRSRGEVVLSALGTGNIDAIERYLDTLEPAGFNAFNLLYGDAHTLRVAYARPSIPRVVREDVPAGIHVLPNDVLDSPELPKVERARMLAAEYTRRPWPELARALQGVMADHVLPPEEQSPEPPPEAAFSREQARQYQALCIHTPAYGTRSSALLALAPGRVGHFLVSDKPPCQQDFRDFGGLLSPQ